MIARKPIKLSADSVVSLTGGRLSQSGSVIVDAYVLANNKLYIEIVLGDGGHNDHELEKPGYGARQEIVLDEEDLLKALEAMRSLRKHNSQ